MLFLDFRVLWDEYEALDGLELESYGIPMGLV